MIKISYEFSISSYLAHAVIFIANTVTQHGFIQK